MAEKKKEEDELKRLKQNVAEKLFLHNYVHESLIEINNLLICCGCESCTYKEGPNYLQYEFCRGPGQEEGDGQAYWKSSISDVKPVPVSQCLLYQWFKTQCEEWKAPIPDDAFDSPAVRPLSLTLAQSLGMDIVMTYHKQWSFRVDQLSYQQQIDTVYHMIHSWTKMIVPADSHLFKESFEQWFFLRNSSLLL